MSKKAMISLPMAGKPEAQIKSEIGVARSRLESLGYEVVDTFFGDITEYGQVINPPLYFLAKSLEQMSHFTMVYFCDGWENARGCIIEHGAAKAYGLDVIYEKCNASDLP